VHLPRGPVNSTSVHARVDSSPLTELQQQLVTMLTAPSPSTATAYAAHERYLHLHRLLAYRGDIDAAI
jgi:hypothetical protein